MHRYKASKLLYIGLRRTSPTSSTFFNHYTYHIFNTVKIVASTKRLNGIAANVMRKDVKCRAAKSMQRVLEKCIKRGQCAVYSLTVYNSETVSLLKFYTVLYFLTTVLLILYDVQF